MSSLYSKVFHVPPISVERRAAAVLKLKEFEAIPAALVLTITYLAHYGGADCRFAECLKHAAEDFRAALAAGLLVTDELPLLALEELYWHAVVLGFHREVLELLGTILGRHPHREQSPGIRAFLSSPSEHAGLQQFLRLASQIEFGFCTGVIDSQQGSPAEILQRCDRWCNRRPDDIESLFSRAQAYHANNDDFHAYWDMKEVYERQLQAGRGYAVKRRGDVAQYFPFTVIGRADAMVLAVELKYPIPDRMAEGLVEVESIQGNMRAAILTLDED